MAGGILQLAMQWPFLVKMGVRLKPDFHFRHPGVRRIGMLMLPATFGAAIYQINVFIGTILASLLPTGSVSYLYYADRIGQLPLRVQQYPSRVAQIESVQASGLEGDRIPAPPTRAGSGRGTKPPCFSRAARA